MTQQKCNSPECNLFAEYKAPLSPDNLGNINGFAYNTSRNTIKTGIISRI